MLTSRHGSLPYGWPWWRNAVRSSGCALGLARERHVPEPRALAAAARARGRRSGRRRGPRRRGRQSPPSSTGRSRGRAPAAPTTARSNSHGATNTSTARGGTASHGVEREQRQQRGARPRRARASAVPRQRREPPHAEEERRQPHAPSRRPARRLVGEHRRPRPACSRAASTNTSAGPGAHAPQQRSASRWNGTSGEPSARRGSA